MQLRYQLATAGGSLILASGSMLGMINQWEGRSYPVYLDIGGVPTVCEGHTGPEVVMGDTWTKRQCDQILANNATKYAQGILKCVTVPINQNQFDALTLFAINVGIAGACKSRAVREINKSNYVIGCSALAHDPKGKPAWSYVNDKFVRGLHNRRIFEKELCLKPVEKFMPLSPLPEAPAPVLPSPMETKPAEASRKSASIFPGVFGTALSSLASLSFSFPSWSESSLSDSEMLSAI